MAISPDGHTLFPMLEGALIGDPDSRRRVLLCYDIPHGAFGEHRRQYRVEEPGHAIGDLAALDSRRLLVIERDDAEGAEAGFKRVYLVDLRRTDADGFLVKPQVVNLLEIPDPDGIAPAEEGALGLGDPFALPFQTIESILPLGRDRLLIINDNNCPFSAGRPPGVPDDTEAVVLRVRALRHLLAAAPEHSAQRQSPAILKAVSWSMSPCRRSEEEDRRPPRGSRRGRARGGIPVPRGTRTL